MVTWSAPASEGGSAVTAYEITVGDRVEIVNGTTRTAFVTGLEPGEYRVTVRAQNAGGWSPASAPVTLVLEPDAPAAPVIAVAGSLEVGGTITVTGSGFTADARYRVELRSAPILLGDVAADASGAFRLEAAIPADFDAGVHTVVVMLDGEDIAALTVQIAAAEGDPDGPGPIADPGDLVQTGSDLGWAPWALGFAALLLLAGGVLLAVRRRLAD